MIAFTTDLESAPDETSLWPEHTATRDLTACLVETRRAQFAMVLRIADKAALDRMVVCDSAARSKYDESGSESLDDG